MAVTIFAALLVLLSEPAYGRVTSQEPFRDRLQSATTVEEPWPPADAYRPGSGVTLPRVLEHVAASYTAEALRAKVQGKVVVECVVEVDGTVNRIRIVKSLDPYFGLDEAVVNAAKRWRFTPGAKDGQAVPVLVTMTQAFSLWTEKRPLWWRWIPF
jgi:TonB family protein